MKYSNILKSTLTILLISTHVQANALSKVSTEPYEYTGFKGQVVAAQKGTFQVPENRSDPKSRLLNISFVTFPSTSKNPKRPIVYLAGGPGGSATGTAKRPRFALFQKLREVSDVILYDQRGTGLSNDIDKCQGSNSDMTIPSDETTLMATIITDIKTCVEQWQKQGVDLKGYTTKENSHDLADLSKALGVDKVNLWAISYGTHLAFSTAKYHPEIINQMVLASSEGLNHTIKRPARIQALIEKVDLMLKQNPKTADKYPDLLGTMKTVLNKLAVTPQVVKAKSFRGKDITVGISKIDLQFVISYVLLMDPKYLSQMPKMFYQMEQGDFTSVAPYVAYIKSQTSSYSAMSIAMDAASGISDDRWAMVQEEAKTSLVGRTTNQPFPDINHVVPVDDAGDQFSQEVVTDIPTLFLAGTLDGRTIYESQIELTKNFSNKSIITIDGAGHNLYVSHPDVATSVVSFLQGEKVPTKTITLAPIEFH